MRAIVRVLVEQAKSGNVVAAREIFDRVLGKAAAGPLPERAEAELLAAMLEVIDLHASARLRAWVSPDVHERQELAALPVEGVQT